MLLVLENENQAIAFRKCFPCEVYHSENSCGMLLNALSLSIVIKKLKEKTRHSCVYPVVTAHYVTPNSD